MNNNSWFKKEKPMLTLPGLGGGSASNLYWSAGSTEPKTYIDDVFSIYCYRGNNGSVASRSINNGIKLGNANAGNSVDFDGSDDYLFIPDSTDFDMDSSDFTMECWYYPRSNPSWVGLIAQWPNGNYNTTNSWTLEPVGGTLNFYYCMTNGTLSNVAAPGSIQTNQWQHCAIVKKNNQLKCFLNGSGSSWVTLSATLQNSTEPLTIGGLVAPSSGSGWANGRISNVRITKGQCLYENNFTPSTEPLTTTSQGAVASNVKLLCCNSRFIGSATVTPNPIQVKSTPMASNGPFTASDGAGGLIWTKSRTSNSYPQHALIDTERGVGQELQTNSNANENYHAERINSFDNSGYKMGNSARYNANNVDYVSWTFKRATGFFDCVTWTGNSTAGRQIPHQLGCKPGLIILKSSSANGEPWYIYQKDLGATKHLKFDTGQASTNTEPWNNTEPDENNFTLAQYNSANGSGKQYVAYLFGGGESTAATARSVDFDGSGDYLLTSSSSDYSFGTGDFTVEHWIKPNDFTTAQVIDGRMHNYGSQTNWCTYITTDNTYRFFAAGDKIVSNTKLFEKAWSHVAIVRNSGTTTLYINGENQGTWSDSTNYNNTQITMGIHGPDRSSFPLDGELSNVRVIKGTALYTSSFKPPTEPLTSISGTGLLCCNNSSVTGATTGTVTSGGNPTASTDSPFDDPAGFVFGESGEENLIKTGLLKCDSNGKSTVYVGWEPQWLMWKKSNGSGGWAIYDAMRGVVANDGGNAGDNYLLAHDTSNEQNTSYDVINFTPTGFEANLSAHPNGEFIYMCLRRSDVYVGKPAELGSDCFQMDSGDGSSSEIPTMYSGFPVDFGLIKRTDINQGWYTGSRLTGQSTLFTDSSNAQSSNSYLLWDSNAGFWKGLQSQYHGLMWRRNGGFDVVAFQGTAANPGPEYVHSLGQVPELKIIKRRNANSVGWITTGTIISQAIAGNNNSKDYYLYLNSDAQATNFSNYWSGNDTSTHFTVRHGNGEGGGSADPYLCLLFASVEGISKVGYYDGQASDLTIVFGFKPRFLMVKRVDAAGDWNVYDTTRGLVSGADQEMRLNNNSSQSGHEVGDITDNGFTFACGGSHDTCSAGKKFIYYAHA